MFHLLIHFERALDTGYFELIDVNILLRNMAEEHLFVFSRDCSVSAYALLGTCFIMFGNHIINDTRDAESLRTVLQINFKVRKLQMLAC